jgi:hypothetical protein
MTLVTSVAAVAAIAAALGYLLWPASNAPPNGAPGQRFDAASVPLIDDEMRRSLATYPTRADHKALAITGAGGGVSAGGGMGVADGQPNAEAAKEDALRRCNATSKRQTNRSIWLGQASAGDRSHEL